ncbi:hypothetical protein LCGC14_1918420 [marine sediment metagenome]|uniref:Uncharacterized protein n=1 Tax=marine sediment metagenome TaxID=412755 RepID=A0A0F9GET9_9ZZZZ
MREYTVTFKPTGEKFPVIAPDGDFQKAKSEGAKAYLRKHPSSKYRITSLASSGKLKVSVVSDRRVRDLDFKGFKD